MTPLSLSRRRSRFTSSVICGAGSSYQSLRAQHQVSTGNISSLHQVLQQTMHHMYLQSCVLLMNLCMQHPHAGKQSGGWWPTLPAWSHSCSNNSNGLKNPPKGWSHLPAVSGAAFLASLAIRLASLGGAVSCRQVSFVLFDMALQHFHVAFDQHRHCEGRGSNSSGKQPRVPHQH